MKISGAELRAFIAEGWPGNDWYWEVSAFDDLPDGMPLASETYDTADFEDEGALKWQGKGEKRDPMPLADVIKSWREARDFDVVAIMVPKDRWDEFRLAIHRVGAIIPNP